MANVGECRRSVSIRHVDDFTAETKHSIHTRMSVVLAKILYSVLHPFCYVSMVATVLVRSCRYIVVDS